MKRITTVLAILLLALVTLLAINMPAPATAAPSAAPTPVAVDRSPTQPTLATLWDRAEIAATGRGGCVNTSAYEKMDLQYVIDQTVVNTITLKLQFTNDSPGDTNATYIDGVTIISGNAADASDLQQFQVFGAWTCIHATVVNANPVTVSAKALLK